MRRRNSCSRCKCDPCKCHVDPCCAPDPCAPDPCMRVNSSDVVYNGGAISEMGITNGMSLNQVIERITSSLVNIYGDTKVLKVANFKGISNVVIKDLSSIELAFYCGGKVPASLYYMNGTKVVFRNQTVDFDDPTAEVTIVYRANTSVI